MVLGDGPVPVYALESGTVYRRGYQAGGAGNYVYVKYPRMGVAVAYFHLTSIAVKQGQSVGRGTRIGVAGTTGGSTGVHLHIGVRNLSTWKWQNPETWLTNYSAPTSNGSSAYRVGATYTLRTNMNVRTGPGTNYSKKKRSALTANARAHCTSASSAVLKKGTKVTCKAVRTVGSRSRLDGFVPGNLAKSTFHRRHSMGDITWMQVLAIMIGSGGITSGAVAITMKLIDRNSITKRTLAVLSYGALSDKIEKLLDQDYATPEQRKEIEEFWKVYKAHGWNGDMDARMAKVHALPTKNLHDE